MTYYQFLSIMTQYKKSYEQYDELQALGFNLISGSFNLKYNTDGLLKKVFEIFYTEEGIEWIEWFINEMNFGESAVEFVPSVAKANENDGNEILSGAYDKEGNPIAYNYYSLWTLLESNFKK